MRWPMFAIVAYLIIALHIALGGFLNIGSASPDLVLPVAVFIAINARREDALIGCLVLGLLRDLFSVHPVGLYGFCYGLAGLFVVGTRPALYRDHPLTHVFLTLGAGLGCGAVIVLNEWSYPVVHHAVDAPGVSIGRAVGAAVYSAAVAPLLLWPLVRVKRVFAFRAARGSGLESRFIGSAGRS